MSPENAFGSTILVLFVGTKAMFGQTGPPTPTPNVLLLRFRRFAHPGRTGIGDKHNYVTGEQKTTNNYTRPMFVKGKSKGKRGFV